MGLHVPLPRPRATIRSVRGLIAFVVLLALALPGPAFAREQAPTVQEYVVPAGTHPHDVAPAPDGGVWYTGQAKGVLGWLDPTSGDVREIPLGKGSAPHGVI